MEKMSKPETGIPPVLTESSLADAVRLLAGMDDDLARLLKTHGTPPLWDRPPGFVTLLRIILEQQVSLISADAMYRRLCKNVQPLTHANILALGADYLRSFGVTRQKASYCINVAGAVESGELDFEKVGQSEDNKAIEMLTSIKGIGPWTAKIYLLMALCRPDVWPVGDIALATAVKNLNGWQTRPTQDELSEIALAWRPHRAAAARLLWHYYLNEQ
jgi:DNA-3-methyladenine glycosylase II